VFGFNNGGADLIGELLSPSGRLALGNEIEQTSAVSMTEILEELPRL
jgi:hypothetical protein